MVYVSKVFGAKTTGSPGESESAVKPEEKKPAFGTADMFKPQLLSQRLLFYKEDPGEI